MHPLFFVGCFSMLILAQLPITDPGQWPGFSNVRICAQDAVTRDLTYYVGCGSHEWTCICDHFSIAQATLESLAISGCSSDAQDVAAATSILDGFCSQLPITSAQPFNVIATDPSQWPGFSNVRICAQDAVTRDLTYYVGCGLHEWTCICDHFSIAQATLESLAISGCSSDAQDVAAATSILDGFCSQLPGGTMATNSNTPLAGATATAVTATTSPAAQPGVGNGGCIINGGNNSDINCNNNSNIERAGGELVRVNMRLLILCLGFAVLVVSVGVAGDTSVGGCIFNGSIQENINCNGNMNNQNVGSVRSASYSRLYLNFHLLIAIYLLFSFGFASADESAGGCIFSGSDQANISCNGNNNNQNVGTGTANGLSNGEIAGIIIGSVTAVLTLLTVGAVILNPKVKIEGDPVWHYRRALLYKFIEGITVGYGCGFENLEKRMQNFVKAGGKWHWAASTTVAGTEAME